MENTNRSTEVPLRNLVEKIIEKKEISAEEQRTVNAMASGVATFNPADFEAISRLTQLICAGQIRVEGAPEQ